MTIGPLAVLAYQDLAGLTARGDEPGVRTWIRRHASKQRRRDTQVLEILIADIAAKMADGSTTYRLELSDADQAGMLCGRLVTAMLNGDTATVEALIVTYTGWDVEDRVDVLTELVLRARQATPPGD